MKKMCKIINKIRTPCGFRKKKMHQYDSAIAYHTCAMTFSRSTITPTIYQGLIYKCNVKLSL